jgi:uncharacterized protein (DUF1501 family)
MKATSNLSRRTLLAGAAAAVPAAAIPALALAAAPDPIFAVIKAYRQATDALNAAPDPADDDPLWALEAEAFKSFIDTRPLTLAGTHAKLACVESTLGADTGVYSTAMWLRVMRNSVPASTTALGNSPTTEPDPILAVIEVHRRYDAELDALLGARNAAQEQFRLRHGRIMPGVK